METPSPYHPPVKRSLSIAGHQTSISLEPLFWEMLKAAAAHEGLAVAALVARIDAERIALDSTIALASGRQCASARAGIAGGGPAGAPHPRFGVGPAPAPPLPCRSCSLSRISIPPLDLNQC